jgi:glutathione synthase/RimK-type ligase-like ATP-grasp enzyme
MNIAIHNQGEKDMSLHWISHCKENKIHYKIVNCFDSDIIHQLSDCEVLMFHINVGDPSKLLMGKQLLYTLETSGKKVFPDFKTMWHYDDKVGQKYLLEQIGAPLVPTYIFYEEETAIQWAANTSFPKVFKLRNGAGSSNVRLINSREKAVETIQQAFGKGFSHQNDPWLFLKESWRMYKLDKIKFGGVKYAIKRLFYIPVKERKYGVERGYVYFQEFIPENNFDIRIIVIGKKAFGIKRMVRNNDFRASGSGIIDYEKENFDENTLKLSFELAKKLNTQSVAFDFVYLDSKPYVVEISYAFKSVGVYEKCEGYWDEQLNWYPGTFNPYGWMVDDLIDSNKGNKFRSFST